MNNHIMAIKGVWWKAAIWGWVVGLVVGCTNGAIPNENVTLLVSSSINPTATKTTMVHTKTIETQNMAATNRFQTAVSWLTATPTLTAIPTKAILGTLESYYLPQRPKDLVGVVIFLERTGCYGTCPSYNLEINGSGMVAYHGKFYVSTPGKFEYNIPIENVKKIVDLFYDYGFFSWRDEYVNWGITDQRSYTISIVIGDYMKRVFVYPPNEAPDLFIRLAHRIDELSEVLEYVGSN